jgi:hypothetical protein
VLGTGNDIIASNKREAAMLLLLHVGVHWHLNHALHLWQATQQACVERAVRIRRS